MKISKRIFCVLTSLLLLSGCANQQHDQVSSNKADIKNAAKINTDLGLTYIRLGEFQRAKTKLMLAMDQDPYYSGAYGAMGYYQEMTGESQQAENYYLRAIKLARDKGAAYNNYGAYLCRQGQYVKGVDYLLRAAQTPTYIHQSGAYANAGACEMRNGQYAQAETYFEKAYAKDQSQAALLLDWAEAAYKQKNFQQAKTKVEEYLATHKPDSRSVSLGLDIAHALQANDMAQHYAALMINNKV